LVAGSVFGARSEDLFGDGCSNNPPLFFSEFCNQSVAVNTVNGTTSLLLLLLLLLCYLLAYYGLLTIFCIEFFAITCFMVTVGDGCHLEHSNGFLCGYLSIYFVPGQIWLQGIVTYCPFEFSATNGWLLVELEEGICWGMSAVLT
jgi:hypothetical protein